MEIHKKRWPAKEWIDLIYPTQAEVETCAGPGNIKFFIIIGLPFFCATYNAPNFLTPLTKGTATPDISFRWQGFEKKIGERGGKERSDRCDLWGINIRTQGKNDSAAPLSEILTSFSPGYQGRQDF